MSDTQRVADEISGQPREVGKQTSTAKTAAVGKQQELPETQKPSGSSVNADAPLLTQSVVADTSSAPQRQRLTLSTRQFLCIALFCTAVLVGMAVIIGLLAALLVRPVQTSAVAPVTPAPAANIVTTRRSTRPPPAVASESPPTTEANQEPFNLELDTRKLPKCPTAAADGVPVATTGAADAYSACIRRTWIILRGIKALPIGPFACSPGYNCRAVQPVAHQLQVVLPGTYRIRAQASVRCSHNTSTTNQPIILALFAPNEEAQLTDNHQVCGPRGSVQTIHTAAMVALKPGDRVQLKLLNPTMHPVELGLLSLRASSQMTWEEVPTG